MYDFNSIYSLNHFLRHYGIHQYDECCFGDGVVTLHGKQIAKYSFAKQSGMPIFEFEDEYYNQCQKDNREEALKNWVGCQGYKQYSIENNEDSNNVVFIGKYSYCLPFDNTRLYFDVWLDRAKYYLYVVDDNGTRVWRSFFKTQLSDIEQNVMKVAWAFLGL